MTAPMTAAIAKPHAAPSSPNLIAKRTGRSKETEGRDQARYEKDCPPLLRLEEKDEADGKSSKDLSEPEGPYE